MNGCWLFVTFVGHFGQFVALPALYKAVFGHLFGTKIGPFWAILEHFGLIRDHFGVT